MIDWISSHDETFAGAVVRFRIGTPSPAFWEDWKGNPSIWQKRGYQLFQSQGDWFIKAPDSIIVEPPAKKRSIIPAPNYLRSYQKIHFRNLWNCLNDYTAYIDGSDTGTGKTWVNLSICQALGLVPFVVCPLSAIAVWRKVTKKLGLKIYGIGNYEYFKGENSYGTMETIFYPGKIYQAYTGAMPNFPKQKSFSDYNEALDYLQKRTPLRIRHIKDWEKKHNKRMRSVCRSILGYSWNLPKDTAMIFDEVHKCKADDSQNMRLLSASKPYITLALSATPGISPRDFKSLGYLLGVHHLYNFNLWTKHHGCHQNLWNGWEYEKESGGMETLSKEVYPAHGARMRISEIPDFPKTNIIAECYTANEASAYRKAYAECLARCKTLTMEGDNKLLVISAIQKYRQATEMLKVPLFCTLINEQIEAGFSVCVFVNFRETLARLSREFQNPPCIYGGQKLAERTGANEAFQTNKSKLILLNMQSGSSSIDLHDTVGKHPRYSLISPTYNPYDLKQVFGRPHRDGAKTVSQQRIIYMADTIEEEVCERVQAKISAFATFHGDMAMAPSDLAEKEISEILNDKELSHITGG